MKKNVGEILRGVYMYFTYFLMIAGIAILIFMPNTLGKMGGDQFFNLGTTMMLVGMCLWFLNIIAIKHFGWFDDADFISRKAALRLGLVTSILLIALQLYMRIELGFYGFFTAPYSIPSWTHLELNKGILIVINVLLTGLLGFSCYSLVFSEGDNVGYQYVTVTTYYTDKGFAYDEKTSDEKTSVGGYILVGLLTTIIPFILNLSPLMLLVFVYFLLHVVKHKDRKSLVIKWVVSAVLVAVVVCVTVLSSLNYVPNLMITQKGLLTYESNLNEEGQLEYVVTGAVDTKITEVYVPSTYFGKPVVLAKGAFLPDEEKGVSYENLEKISVVSGNFSEEIRLGKYFAENNLTTVELREGTYMPGYGEFENLYLPKSVEDFESIGNVENIYYGGTVADWLSIKFDNEWNKNPMRYCSNFYILDGNGEYQLLQDVEIPSTVTSIGDYAFYGCTGLTSIVIPNSVTSIGNNAFQGCENLESITLPFSVNFDSIFSWDRWHSDSRCSAPASLKKIVITGGTSIVDEAFYGCSNVVSITLPDSLTSIGKNAFKGCESLISITIPSGVTKIGDAAFYECTCLMEVCNKSSLTITTKSEDNGYVGYYAKHIITDEADTYLTTIDDCIFYDDGKNVYLAKYAGNDSQVILPDYNGEAYGIYDKSFYGCKSLTSVTISDSVTFIGGYAFYGCEGLTTIIIPNNVTSIRDYAFYGCCNLKTVDFEEGSQCETIGFYAFYDCISLTSFTIPDSVKLIGGRTFYGCTNLTSIVILNDNLVVGAYSFVNCNKLSSVYYAGTVEQWNNVRCDSYNENLLNATRYYYSATVPTEDGNYWHYAEDGVTPVVWE